MNAPLEMKSTVADLLIPQTQGEKNKRLCERFWNKNGPVTRTKSQHSHFLELRKTPSSLKTCELKKKKIITQGMGWSKSKKNTKSKHPSRKGLTGRREISTLTNHSIIAAALII